MRVHWQLRTTSTRGNPSSTPTGAQIVKTDPGTGWEVRFWGKVDKTGECWEWLASLTDTGYGQFFIRGSRWRAHRLTYFMAHGELNPELEIDHLCRNRKCVRPDHLEEVTRRENLKRGLGRLPNLIDATHCKHGHEFTESNTYRYYYDGSTHRQCKTCNADRKRKYRKDDNR